MNPHTAVRSLLHTLLLAGALVTSTACKKAPAPEQPTPKVPTPAAGAYFPPNDGAGIWQAKAAPTNWDTAALNAAMDWAFTKNTYGVVLLHGGRIVYERYANNWDTATTYAFNSASKSLVAMLVGQAVAAGKMHLDSPSSTYLGKGWSSLSPAQERAITLRHHLTMTTGLDEEAFNENCTFKSCLVYRAPAGTRWAYHNAPYVLLHKALANLEGGSFDAYVRTHVSGPVGMSAQSNFLQQFFSPTTRDAARFGLLALRKGFWGTTNVIGDTAFCSQMWQTSQPLNKSYGYLWWLGKKESAMVPGLPTVFNIPLVQDGPDDLYMALGKDDKKTYVVPSLDLVLVRLGDNADAATALGPSGFDNLWWQRLRPAFKY